MGSGNGMGSLQQVANNSYKHMFVLVYIYFTFRIWHCTWTLPAATKVAKIDELPTFTHLLYLSNLIPTN